MRKKGDRLRLLVGSSDKVNCAEMARDPVKPGIQPLQTLRPGNTYPLVLLLQLQGFPNANSHTLNSQSHMLVYLKVGNRCGCGDGTPGCINRFIKAEELAISLS